MTTSNSIALIERVGDPLEFCNKMALAAARMCGAGNEQDGQAINLVCLQENITYIEFSRRYHLIRGKPSMRADAMLGEFRQNFGGDYEIGERSPERAAMAFVDAKGRKYEMAFTWKEAQESRWPWVDWKDHDAGLKDSWATPTDRKSMLFARLVSDSLRAICPELVAGIYTPEEMGDVVDGEVVPRPEKKVKTVNEMIAAASQEEPAIATTEIVKDDGEIVDGSFELVPDEPKQTDNSCTKSQRDKMQSLFDLLSIPKSKQDEIIAKRGVGAMVGLTKVQADEIIQRLEAVKQQQGK